MIQSNDSLQQNMIIFFIFNELKISKMQENILILRPTPFTFYIYYFTF